VKRQQSRLSPGSTAAVIGIGGLGSYAVQYLRLLTGARVVAIDTVHQRLADARRLGAHATVVGDENASEALPVAADGVVDVVFDFVGSTDSLTTAVSSIGCGAGGDRRYRRRRGRRRLAHCSDECALDQHDGVHAGRPDGGD
jgi:propanol-preferring alcohol dehydrogenase